MRDTSVTKVKAQFSPKGALGQTYLASGVHVAMRLWEHESPGAPQTPSQRDYETVGYVMHGRAELHLEGQKVMLEPGDSWVVPKGALQVLSQSSVFGAKSKNWVSEIQWLTDCQNLEKATLRQNLHWSAS